eukprot:SAG25_NODE_5734_length_625_cov_0.872624_1_plen_28_part_10
MDYILVSEDQGHLNPIRFLPIVEVSWHN